MRYKTIQVPYTVTADDVEKGYVENTARTCRGNGAVGRCRCNLKVLAVGSCAISIQICDLKLTKTADKDTAERGEEITSYLSLSSECCHTNVTLWDVLPREVEMLYVYPAPSYSTSGLTSDIGTLCGEFKATIKVRSRGSIYATIWSRRIFGEGFVNVHNDYVPIGVQRP